jgi:hypothetical protein
MLNLRGRILVLLLGSLLAVPAAHAAPVSRPAVAAPPSPLPWIQDDYPRAVALAKARKVPIFVEAWAPW